MQFDKLTEVIQPDMLQMARMPPMLKGRIFPEFPMPEIKGEVPVRLMEPTPVMVREILVLQVEKAPAVKTQGVGVITVPAVEPSADRAKTAGVSGGVRAEREQIPAMQQL